MNRDDVRRAPRRGAMVNLLLPAVAALALAGAGTSAEANGSRWETVADRGVLIAGIRRDNPPHSFIDPQGEWVGFDVDIGEALARHLGLELERVPVDELTRISYLRNGRIDVAIASMSHTRKRDEQVDFSQTYFWASQTFLVRDGGVQRLEDLVGKPVGMDRGSHAIGNWKAWLAKHGHPVDTSLIQEFTSKQAAVQAVKSGAIAGYAEDYTMLAAFARREPELRVLDAAIGMKQDGIGVRENDSRMRDRINYGLQRIESSGDYDEIYDRWFGPESDTPVPLRHRIEVWPDG